MKGQPDGAALDPARDEAVRARIRKMLAVILLLCLVLASAGFAFVRWLATLPPGTLKKP
jgi:hypothetical protein